MFFAGKNFKMPCDFGGKKGSSGDRDSHLLFYVVPFKNQDFSSLLDFRPWEINSFSFPFFTFLSFRLYCGKSEIWQTSVDLCRRAENGVVIESRTSRSYR